MVTAPGQRVDELVSHMAFDDLTQIVGQDIVDTVSAINLSGSVHHALQAIASDALYKRPETLFVKGSVRRICYDAMSSEKLAELDRRLGLDGSNVDVRNIDPSLNTDTWQRFVGFFGIDARSAAPAIAEPDQENIMASFGLFPHQRRAANRVVNALRGGHSRVVLHMPTGAGKTRTAMHVICRLLNKAEPSLVIWLASSAELLEQASDAFQMAWDYLGNRELSLFRFWGEHSSNLSDIQDGLIVAGFQKLYAYHKKNPLDILRVGARTSLVVVDEAHQAIAPTYKEVISNLSETGSQHSLLGLTATPGRSWSDISADEQLSEFFGEKKVMLEVEGWDDPVSYLIAEGYLAKPTFRKLEYTDSPNLKKPLTASGDYSDETLETLAQSINRNISIIDEIKRLIANGHKRIIFFSASVRHAEIIAAALNAIDIDARIVTGKTPSLQRKRIIRDFKSPPTSPIVVCNFGVLTTGFDAPNTSAAVIGRPTRSLVLYSQMVGRATRGPKAGGNATCEVSTVVDIDLPGFGDIADAFTNWEDVWDEPA